MQAAQTVPIFSSDTKSISSRIDAFIEWGKPFGKAGINANHREKYIDDAPYFDWGVRFLSNGDTTARSWFLKWGYLRDGRSVFSRARNGDEPKIYKPEGLISPGRFLRFAKAYLNVLSTYKDLRYPAREILLALSYLESALADLNNGDNDPVNISSAAFKLADKRLMEDEWDASTRVEISYELDILAGMLQEGCRRRRFGFSGCGFNLVLNPFVFDTDCPPLARDKRRKSTTSGKPPYASKQRMTSEDVAAVGMAYRKSIALHGRESHVAFMSATASLSLITISMRVSEIVVLKDGAIYFSEDSSRYRINLHRPKIDLFQDLPIPKKFSGLVEEVLDQILDYTAEARRAFDFYITKFKEFESIDELYIPSSLRKVFDAEVLTLESVCSVIGREGFEAQWIYEQLPIERYVESYGDISPLSGQRHTENDLVRISDIERVLAGHRVITRFPSDADKSKFITKIAARDHLYSHKSVFTLHLLDHIFSTIGRKATRCVRTDALLKLLLADFKRQVFPHWPFITKDRTTKLNESLFVHFQVLPMTMDKPIRRMWWIPGPLATNVLNRWINGDRETEPILFKYLDIRLDSGRCPRITLHKTRKWHQTEALLAGANLLFIDELAGRNSGYQSSFYDQRTPSEILLQSIETFDPDVDLAVVGPVDDQARLIPIVDRKVFLFENAAPKHVTDVGGCKTDWSLNPCDLYGECFLCDSQVWRKGDVKRIGAIVDKRRHCLEMLEIGRAKYTSNPESDSIANQLRQFENTLLRCDQILAVEADDSIAIGTIVTFESAPGMTRLSELASNARRASQ